MSESKLPREWIEEQLPLGTIFTFHAARAPGARGGLILGLVVLALCIYWDWLFIENWFIDGAEILLAGVALFVVILGGAAFGIYCLLRVFSRTSYLLGGDSLTVTEKSLLKNTSKKYLKQQIQSINLIRTPSRDPALPDTCTLTLDMCDLHGGKVPSLVLEGSGEVEAKYLSQRLSSWCGAKVTTYNSDE